MECRVLGTQSPAARAADGQAMGRPVSDTQKHYLETELEERLRTDPEIWTFLRAGSLDGVWYWDLEKPDAEWLSPEFWALFGIDAKTKRHDPAEWQDLIDPDDLRLAVENFEKHCADPNHPYDQIVRYRHANGSTVWVRCRGIAIRDAAGKPVRMLGAHTDVTALKRTELEAREALRTLETANEDLKAFTYSISHDLKSPSNTMDLLLKEILVSDTGGLSDEQRELIEMAQSITQQMRELVEDMLSYTRLIGNRLRLEPVPLGQLAREVRDRLSATIDEVGAEVVIDGSLPVVAGHVTQLTALLQNLMENALKYRDPDRPPRIRIAALGNAPKGFVGFTITDNGVGIPFEAHEQIFEIFKRLHRSDQVQGSGLGLSICRRVAQNHGGSISVASEPDNGACFTVQFPR